MLFKYIVRKTATSKCKIAFVVSIPKSSFSNKIGSKIYNCICFWSILISFWCTFIDFWSILIYLWRTLIYCWSTLIYLWGTLIGFWSTYICCYIFYCFFREHAFCSNIILL